MNGTKKELHAFTAHLRSAGRSPSTVEKYLRDVRAFLSWLDDRPLDPGAAAGWRDHLLNRGRAPVTVNSMLSALHRFLGFLGREDCRTGFLRIQRRTFRAQDRELTRAEYQKLLEAAQAQGNRRLALLMETVCSTGIRVSEVRYITV